MYCTVQKHADTGNAETGSASGIESERMHVDVCKGEKVFFPPDLIFYSCRKYQLLFQFCCSLPALKSGGGKRRSFECAHSSCVWKVPQTDL